IYFLSLGRSFRSLNDVSLINWGSKDFLRCCAEITDENEDTMLEVFYSSSPIKKKNFKKNEVNLRNSEYLGNLITVLFHPEDLNMLYLGPDLRRRYMDILLSQSDKKYLRALFNYKKILRQRRSLLKTIQQGNTSNLLGNLSAWDDQIVEHGSVIILKRLELIDFLSENIEKIYRSISRKSEKIEIKYKNTIISDITEKEGIQATYKEKLLASRERDVKEARSTVGPHLDDLKFYINSVDIKKSASRGEFRTMLMSLKLAEIEFLILKTGKKPILLLDDIFSELDNKRRKHLLNAIKGYQTIITSTDEREIGELAKESTDIEFVQIE
ncbi:DNA replication and repair protein RecF, partial [Candidatus Peregrinibacteria bacterium]|nr:DNA replication and repair protein RecF [Candidatus Peregrinibacteria bacterium]